MLQLRRRPPAFRRNFRSRSSAGPIRFFLNGGHRLDSVEEAVFFLGILDIGIDEQGIGLGMDILHHDLEAIEAAGFGELHFAHEIHGEVLVDDAVAGGEEGQDMRDEMAFSSLSLFQCCMSPLRSISSAVQKLASCFLYISQTLG